MATKRKKSSNPKRNAVLTILLTIIVAAVCLYTVLVGLGPKHLGSAKNIELGLDLAGGVSVTYEVNEDNPSQTDMDDTIYKLQLRVQNYSTESEVYQEGSNRLTVEIPGATNANEILEELGKPGDLSFQTEDGTEVLTGANIKSAEAGTYDENGINNYVVSLTMDEAGKEAFADATAANIGKPISSAKTSANLRTSAAISPSTPFICSGNPITIPPISFSKIIFFSSVKSFSIFVR